VEFPIKRHALPYMRGGGEEGQKKMATSLWEKLTTLLHRGGGRENNKGKTRYFPAESPCERKWEPANTKKKVAQNFEKDNKGRRPTREKKTNYFLVEKEEQLLSKKKHNEMSLR